MKNNPAAGYSLSERILRRINAALIAASLSVVFSPLIIAQNSATVIPLGEGIEAKSFFASVIDERNIAWFLTDQGIVSFDGAKWNLHNKNRKITPSGLRDMAYDNSSYGPELWIATPQGATVASLPIDARSGATTYYPGNSAILSENVFAVAIGKKGLRWFGTDKGISAFRERKWLTNNYHRKYPDGTFLDFQITALETSRDGDSLYIGTSGGGVMRVYRDDVDAISGASEYAAWGPILMPSDNVTCIHVSADGTQWIGTDKGVAKHTGYNTLEGWYIITKEDGLADDFIQAIDSDSKGNIYVGTRNGLSVFDGETWRSYNADSGLSGNNVLTVAIAKNDVVWIGTDNGVTSFRDGVYTIYR